MSTPYEQHGRTEQKQRTRAALVAAARELVARGSTPTVEDAAEAASVSRTTAYRYFPNQRALLAAAHPETAATSLLAEDPPDDPASGSTPCVEAFTAIIVEHRGPAADDAAALAGAADAERRSCPCGRAGRSGGSPKRWSRARRAVRRRAPPARAGDPQCHRHRGAGLAHRHRGSLARRSGGPHAIERPRHLPGRTHLRRRPGRGRAGSPLVSGSSRWVGYRRRP